MRLHIYRITASLLVVTLLIAGTAEVFGSMLGIDAVPDRAATMPVKEGGHRFPVGRKQAPAERYRRTGWDALGVQNGGQVSGCLGELKLSNIGSDATDRSCSLMATGRATLMAQAGYRSGSDNVVTCESEHHRLTECDMNTRGDVELVRELSSTECIRGDNWGLSRHSVWVKDGCRAVFRNEDAPSSRRHGRREWGSGPSALAACDRQARAAGSLVTRVPVNDDVLEVIIDYPDGRYLCMVRSDGWVQSLTRMRH